MSIRIYIMHCIRERKMYSVFVRRKSLAHFDITLLPILKWDRNYGAQVRAHRCKYSFWVVIFLSMIMMFLLFQSSISFDKMLIY